MPKPLRFVGRSLQDLKAWPDVPRREAGFNLGRLEEGKPPADFKIMRTIGAGAYELRIRQGGAWRVIYVAKFEEAVYVLHAFQKKTQKTSPTDIKTAQQRYADMLRIRGG